MINGAMYRTLGCDRVWLRGSREEGEKEAKEGEKTQQNDNSQKSSEIALGFGEFFAAYDQDVLAAASDKAPIPIRVVVT